MKQSENTDTSRSQSLFPFVLLAWRAFCFFWDHEYELLIITQRVRHQGNKSEGRGLDVCNQQGSNPVIRVESGGCVGAGALDESIWIHNVEEGVKLSPL